jgi:hypothetical protein
MADDPVVYLTRAQVSRFTTLSASYLAHAGASGPLVHRVGRRVLYRLSDVLAWLDSKRAALPRRRGRPRKGRA